MNYSLYTLSEASASADLQSVSCFAKTKDFWQQLNKSDTGYLIRKRFIVIYRDCQLPLVTG
jgi:hypothetical protein